MGAKVVTNYRATASECFANQKPTICQRKTADGFQSWAKLKKSG